jgi:hypothetical protein
MFRMKKIGIILFVSFFSLAGGSLMAQQPGTVIWKTLAKITFQKQYDEMLGFKVDVPVFSEDVRELEGDIVEVKGYIIPVEGYKSHKEFVFSAFPYNMCYFCGGAGPETVMEVYSKEPIKYTAEPIIIRGKLQLNSGDINRLIYGLSEAELIKK